MKTFINQPRVSRRARLSHAASVGGLLLLLGSVLLPLFAPGWSGAATPLMIGGMGVSMVGIYFANRWVRKPRPEESLAARLKTLDDRHCLFHYPRLPCDHLLLTPTGLVALETYNLAGSFTYSGGRWREAMTIGRALRSIVEDRLGNPAASARQIEAEMQALLRRQLVAEPPVPVKVVFVFTHPAAALDAPHAPFEVCRVEKLRRHIGIDGPRLPEETFGNLQAFLERATLD